MKRTAFALVLALIAAPAVAQSETKTIRSPTLGCIIISDGLRWNKIHSSRDQAAIDRFIKETVPVKLCSLYDKGAQVYVEKKLTVDYAPWRCARKTGETQCGWIHAIYIEGELPPP